MTNEKLINEAREAVRVAKDSIWRTSPDADGDARHEAVLDQMLAVFEKAHTPPTPTDDERKVVADLIWGDALYSEEIDTTEATDRLIAHFRRSVVPEPSLSLWAIKAAIDIASTVFGDYDDAQAALSDIHMLLAPEATADPQAEPSDSWIDRQASKIIADRHGSDPTQGEPSDAQVVAAGRELFNRARLGNEHADMTYAEVRGEYEADARAALRAASSVIEQEQN